MGRVEPSRLQDLPGRRRKGSVTGLRLSFSLVPSGSNGTCSGSFEEDEGVAVEGGAQRTIDCETGRAADGETGRHQHLP